MSNQEFFKAVGARVRQAREAKGWSKKKLAKEAKTYTSKITKMEEEGSNLTLITIRKLSEALGVKPCYFYDWE